MGGNPPATGLVGLVGQHGCGFGHVRHGGEAAAHDAAVVLVYFLRRPFAVGERAVAAFGQHHVKIQIVGSAHGAFDAVFGHHADDNQAADVVLVQVVQQIRAFEGAAVLFVDNALTRLRGDARGNLPAGAAGL